MAVLNTQALVDKLNKLNNSQQSIETVSAWCIFYRKVQPFPLFHTTACCGQDLA